MELTIINDQGKKTASFSAPDALFASKYNESLIHQIVVAYQANSRLGTRAQKGRSDIAKSTRKPWRQKGTGRARAGMASSPLWRGGGKIFPASPDENFSQKINKKMYRAGIRSILSQLVRENRLSMIEKFEVTAAKTKELARKIKNLGFDSVMIITDKIDNNLQLAARNLPHVLIIETKKIDPVSLLRFSNVLITRNAMNQFQESLQ